MANKKIKYKIKRTKDYVSISDSKGEVVYWDSQEWKDDPSLKLTINNAIKIARKGENIRTLISKPYIEIEKRNGEYKEVDLKYDKKTGKSKVIGIHKISKCPSCGSKDIYPITNSMFGNFRCNNCGDHF